MNPSLQLPFPSENEGWSRVTRKVVPDAGPTHNAPAQPGGPSAQLDPSEMARWSARCGRDWRQHATLVTAAATGQTRHYQRYPAQRSRTHRQSKLLFRYFHLFYILSFSFFISFLLFYLFINFFQHCLWFDFFFGKNIYYHLDFCFGLLEPRLMVQLVFRVFTIPFLGWFVSIYQLVSTESGKKDKKKMGCICHLFFANFVRLLVIGSADCRSPVFPSNFWVRIRSVATEFRSRKEGYQIYFSTGIFCESIAPIYRLYLKIDWFDLLSMFDLGADFIVWFRSTFLGLIRFDGDSSHRVFGYWHSVSHSEIGLNRIELSWWIDPSIYYHWFVVEAGWVSMAEMRPLFQIFRVSCGGLAVAALLSRVWYERRGESEQADWADWAEWVEWSRWMAECRASE